MSPTESDPERSPEPEGPALRAPEGVWEVFVANFRPQPALPAAIVFVFTIMVALIFSAPGAVQGEEGSLLLWLTPLGIVVSCGLALAAGCCSFFPQLLWLMMALWAIRFTNDSPLPVHNRYFLIAGMIAVVAMIFIQVWRVRSGRFLPTVSAE